MPYEITIISYGNKWFGKKGFRKLLVFFFFQKDKL